MWLHCEEISEMDYKGGKKTLGLLQDQTRKGKGRRINSLKRCVSPPSVEAEDAIARKRTRSEFWRDIKFEFWAQLS